MFKRFAFLVMLMAIALSAASGAPTASGQNTSWPANDWPTSTPEAQGMHSGELAAFFETWSQPHFNFDSMVVVRHGTIVAEAYGPLTQPETIREMASCSKSVTSALAGVLLQEGLLDSLDTPILEFFPDMTTQNVDAKKQAVTVRDLLTMSSGIECNDVIMETTEDWLQYALDLPISGEPGEQWNYCNAPVHILSGMITQLTGMSAADYAAEKLFAPLGITDYTWTGSPTGITLGYSDLKLSARDMAKFGYLYLNDGQWEGQQIIPADYAQASLVSQIATQWDAIGYGFLWWHFEPINVTYALGWAGKYILLLPDKDMVVVLTSAMTQGINTGLQHFPLMFAAISLTAAEEPLPDNGEAFERLQTVLQNIHEPSAQPVPLLPAVAAEVSGQRYGLSATDLFLSSEGYKRFANYYGVADKLGVNWLKLDFDESAEAVLTFGFTDNQAWSVPVGLDGLYRVSEGRTGAVGAKGEWLGDDLFRVYLLQNSDPFQHRFDFNFMPGGVYIISYEYASGGANAVQGVLMQ